MSTVALLVNQAGFTVLGELSEDSAEQSFGGMVPVTSTSAAYDLGVYVARAVQFVGDIFCGDEGGITPIG